MTPMPVHTLGHQQTVDEGARSLGILAARKPDGQARGRGRSQGIRLRSTAGTNLHGDLCVCVCVSE